MNLTVDNRIAGQTTIKITMPAGTIYHTRSENGGKREVLVIPNQIAVKIMHQAADSSGESIILQTLAPSELAARG